MGCTNKTQQQPTSGERNDACSAGGEVCQVCLFYPWVWVCSEHHPLLFLFAFLWVNYNDLTRPQPKSWFMWGIAPQPPYFRLVNYYNSPRFLSLVLHISRARCLLSAFGLTSFASEATKSGSRVLSRLTWVSTLNRSAWAMVIVTFVDSNTKPAASALPGFRELAHRFSLLMFC